MKWGYLSILLAVATCLPSLLFAQSNIQLTDTVKGVESTVLVGKMNAYVAAINRHSGRVYDSYNRYLSWADAESGPTGNERIVYGLYEIYDPQTALENAKEGASFLADTLDIDLAARDYADTLIELNDMIEEVYDYYDQEDYLDDDMEYGKEMHPQLMAAFAKNMEADDRLRTGIDDLEYILTARELALLADDPNEYPRYLLKRFMLESKNVVKLGSFLTDEIDEEGFAEAVATMNGTLKEWSEFTKSDKGKVALQTEESIDDFLTGAAKDFQKTAKGLNRRLKNNTPYTTGEKMNLTSLGGMGAWMVEGSPNRLLYDYNNMVDAFNRL